MSDDEWNFSEGDIIREEYEPHAPGGVPLGRSEFRIKWKLRRETTGDRCYNVETAEGGEQLYTAKTLEIEYEVIDASESREFDDNGGA